MSTWEHELLLLILYNVSMIYRRRVTISTNPAPRLTPSTTQNLFTDETNKDSASTFSLA